MRFARRANGAVTTERRNRQTPQRRHQEGGGSRRLIGPMSGAALFSILASQADGRLMRNGGVTEIITVGNGALTSFLSTLQGAI
jgi:hypothetical protein